MSGGPDFLVTLGRAARDVGVHTAEIRPRDEARPGPRRRADGSGVPDPVATVVLTESDGTLHWSEPAGPGAPVGRRAAGVAAPGRILGEFKFETLPPAA